MISSIGLPWSMSRRLRPGISSLAGVEAELVEDRGVDVGDVVAVLDGVEADLVGRAVDDAALQAAAGHPDGEAEDVMVAAVGTLRTGRATEFGGEDHECFIEQPAAIEVLQQCRRSAGRRPAQLLRMIGLESAVCIPGPAPPAPCWIWMKRTPRSTSRRAASNCMPKSRQCGRSIP